MNSDLYSFCSVALLFTTCKVATKVLYSLLGFQDKKACLDFFYSLFSFPIFAFNYKKCHLVFTLFPISKISIGKSKNSKTSHRFLLTLWNFQRVNKVTVL